MHVVLTIVILLLAPAIAHATELKQDAIAAWDDHVRVANARLEEQVGDKNRFLWTDEVPERSARVRRGEIVVSPVGKSGPEKVPNALIHDWIGAVFIPRATIGSVLSLVHDYEGYRHMYGPTVIESQLHAQNGEEYKFSIVGLKKVLFETIVMDGDFESRCSQLDATRGYCVSYSTRIQEVQGYGTPKASRLPADDGHGYIWRAYTVVKLEERDGGVYAELEGMVLSRDLSAAVQWMIRPAIERVSRNAMSTILRQTREAALSRVAMAVVKGRSQGGGRQEGGSGSVAESSFRSRWRMLPSRTGLAVCTKNVEYNMPALAQP